METIFNFTQLHSIYIETLQSPEKMMQFDIAMNNGQFLFMMFISEEDKKSRDMLFIYMRKTNVMIRLKMYKNHMEGNFVVYISEENKEAMIRELGLKPGNGHFSFENFLGQLNDRIPLGMNREDRQRTYRANRDVVRNLRIVDEEKKTVLIGTRHLTRSKPRVKTLRKLYMYVNADVEDIDRIIQFLQEHNTTLCWTTEDMRWEAKDLNELFGNMI